MTRRDAISETKSWRLYASIVFFIPVLYLIKHARNAYGLSNKMCTDITVTYAIISCIFTVGGWACRCDVMYKHFLRKAKQSRLAYAVFPFAYIGGICLVIFLFHLVSLQSAVDDFLLHGNIIRIYKLFIAWNFFLIMGLGATLHLLALVRGSMR